jgi:hypothetical protein
MHNGMERIKLFAGQTKTIIKYKNTRIPSAIALPSFIVQVTALGLKIAH